MIEEKLFFSTLCRAAQRVHQLNLFAYRLPKIFGSIGFDPLPVNPWVARGSLLQPSAGFTIDPVARKNSRDNLAETAATRDRLQMTDICLRDWTLLHPVQLFAR